MKEKKINPGAQRLFDTLKPKAPQKNIEEINTLPQEGTMLVYMENMPRAFQPYRKNTYFITQQRVIYWDVIKQESTPLTIKEGKVLKGLIKSIFKIAEQENEHFDHPLKNEEEKIEINEHVAKEIENASKKQLDIIKAYTGHKPDPIGHVMEDAPVNAIMLNYYIDALRTLDKVTLKDVETNKKNRLLHQLNTTLKFLGAVAIRDAKCGLPVDKYLSRIIECNNKISILNGTPNNKTKDVKVLENNTGKEKSQASIPIPHHINYLALQLGYDIGATLFPPSTPCLYIEEKINPLDYKKIASRLHGKSAYVLNDDTLYYANSSEGTLIPVENEQELISYIIQNTNKNEIEIRHTGSPKEALSEWTNRVNGKRLFWVGLGSLVQPLTQYINRKKTYIDLDKMTQSKNAIGLHTGRMSVGIYIWRLFLHLGVSFYTIFLDKKLKELSFSERVRLAWQEHGAFIWNDIPWVIVNFLTFLWGQRKTHALASNVLTIATFVLVDAMWGFINLVNTMVKYQNTLKSMQDAWDALMQKIEEKNNVILLSNLVKLSPQTIEDTIRLAFKDNKNLQHSADNEACIQGMIDIALAMKKEHHAYRQTCRTHMISIAQGLLNASAIAFMSFAVFPPLLGPVIYIGVGIAINALTSANTMYKAYKQLKEFGADRDTLIRKKNRTSIEEAKLQALVDDIDALKLDIRYEAGGGLFKMLLDAASVAAVFAAFAFTPFGAGVAIAVGILVATILIEKLASYVGEHYIKPAMKNRLFPPPSEQKVENGDDGDRLIIKN